MYSTITQRRTGICVRLILHEARTDNAIPCLSLAGAVLCQSFGCESYPSCATRHLLLIASRQTKVPLLHSTLVLTKTWILANPKRGRSRPMMYTGTFSNAKSNSDVSGVRYCAREQITSHAQLHSCLCIPHNGCAPISLVMG